MIFRYTFIIVLIFLHIIQQNNVLFKLDSNVEKMYTHRACSGNGVHASIAYHRQKCSFFLTPCKINSLVFNKSCNSRFQGVINDLDRSLGKYRDDVSLKVGDKLLALYIVYST